MAAVLSPWLVRLFERVLDDILSRSVQAHQDNKENASTFVKAEDEVGPSTHAQKQPNLKFVEDGSNLRAIMPSNPNEQRHTQLTQFTDFNEPIRAMLSDTEVSIEATFAVAATRKFSSEHKKAFTKGTKGVIVHLREFEIVISQTSPHVEVSLLIKDFNLRGAIESPTYGRPQPIQSSRCIGERLCSLREKCDILPAGLESDRGLFNSHDTQSSGENEHEISVLGGANLSLPKQIQRKKHVDRKQQDLLNQAAASSKTSSADLLRLINGGMPVPKLGNDASAPSANADSHASANLETSVVTATCDDQRPSDPKNNFPKSTASSHRETNDDSAVLSRTFDSDLLGKSVSLGDHESAANPVASIAQVPSKRIHLHQGHFRFVKSLPRQNRIPHNQLRLLNKPESWQYPKPGCMFVSGNLPISTSNLLASTSQSQTAIPHETPEHATHTSTPQRDQDQIIEINSQQECAPESDAEDSGSSESSEGSPVSSWAPSSVGHKSQWAMNQLALPPDSSAPMSRDSSRGSHGGPSLLSRKDDVLSANRPVPQNPNEPALQQGGRLETNDPSHLVIPSQLERSLYESPNKHSENSNFASTLMSRLKAQQANSNKSPRIKGTPPRQSENQNESSDIEMSTPHALNTYISNDKSSMEPPRRYPRTSQAADGQRKGDFQDSDSLGTSELSRDSAGNPRTRTSTSSQSRSKPHPDSLGEVLVPGTYQPDEGREPDSQQNSACIDSSDEFVPNANARLQCPRDPTESPGASHDTEMSDESSPKSPFDKSKLEQSVTGLPQMSDFPPRASSKRRRDVLSPGRLGKSKRPEIRFASSSQCEDPAVTARMMRDEFLLNSATADPRFTPDHPPQMSETSPGQKAASVPPTVSLVTGEAFAKSVPDENGTLDETEAKIEVEVAAKTAESVFKLFKVTYPVYSAAEKHFTGRCRTIHKLLGRCPFLPPQYWDDFVIFHWTHYRKYTEDCAEEGEEQIPYEQFFRENVREPQHTERILTFETLRAVSGDGNVRGSLSGDNSSAMSPGISEKNTKTAGAASSKSACQSTFSTSLDSRSEKVGSREMSASVDRPHLRGSAPPTVQRVKEVDQGKFQAEPSDFECREVLREHPKDESGPSYQPTEARSSPKPEPRLGTRSFERGRVDKNDEKSFASKREDSRHGATEESIEQDASNQKATQKAVTASTAFAAIHEQSNKDSSSSFAQDNEWWRDENTPFNDFAKRYNSLKVFGGCLETTMAFTDKEQEMSESKVNRRQKRVDILGFRL